MTKLYIRSSNGETPIADLDNLQTLVVGRGADTDIRLPNLEVSHHHLRLVRTEQGWTVTDLDSANGTEINGVAFTGTMLLPGV